MSDLGTLEVKKTVKLKAKVKNCQLIVRVKLPRGKVINDQKPQVILKAAI